jgi:hypothetical protein
VSFIQNHVIPNIFCTSQEQIGALFHHPVAGNDELRSLGFAASAVMEKSVSRCGAVCPVPAHGITYAANASAKIRLRCNGE